MQKDQKKWKFSDMISLMGMEEESTSQTSEQSQEQKSQFKISIIDDNGNNLLENQKDFQKQLNNIHDNGNNLQENIKNLQKLPNNFDLSKLIPMKQQQNNLQIQSTSNDKIKFTIDDTPMLIPTNSLKRDHVEASKIIENNRKYYNLIGQKDIRFSKELNQFDKLTDELLTINHLKIRPTDEQVQLMENAKSEYQLKQIEKKEQELGSTDDDEYDEISKQATNLRYYLTSSNIFCYRCKQQGHYSKNCTQEFKKQIKKCNWCLNPNHDQRDCDQLICYKCYKTGHMQKDCQNKGIQCFKCKKKGHKEQECQPGQKTIMQKCLQRVRCLQCWQKGHINCKKHKKKNDNIYSSEFMQLFAQDKYLPRSTTTRQQNLQILEPKSKKIKKNYIQNSHQTRDLCQLISKPENKKNKKQKQIDRFINQQEIKSSKSSLKIKKKQMEVKIKLDKIKQKNDKKNRKQLANNEYFQEKIQQKEDRKTHKIQKKIQKNQFIQWGQSQNLSNLKIYQQQIKKKM